MRGRYAGAPRSILDRPGDFLAREEGHDDGVSGIDPRRNAPRRSAQRDAPLVRRQAIKARTVERGEGLQAIERALFGEDLGIELERRRRGEDAAAAAGILLVGRG